MLRADEIIALLGLRPLPREGGYYREMYRSTDVIPGGTLPRFAGDKAVATAIYYLLTLSLGRGTAGMQASGLQVTTFLNQTPSRNLMRCRAWATVLSYAAMGMGFAWALIDEDRLCWHDRITHTYLTSK